MDLKNVPIESLKELQKKLAMQIFIIKEQLERIQDELNAITAEIKKR